MSRFTLELIWTAGELALGWGLGTYLGARLRNWPLWAGLPVAVVMCGLAVYLARLTFR